MDSWPCRRLAILHTYVYVGACTYTFARRKNKTNDVQFFTIRSVLQPKNSTTAADATFLLRRRVSVRRCFFSFALVAKSVHANAARHRRYTALALRFVHGRGTIRSKYVALSRPYHVLVEETLATAAAAIRNARVGGRVTGSGNSASRENVRPRSYTKRI